MDLCKQTPHSSDAKRWLTVCQAGSLALIRRGFDSKRFCLLCGVHSLSFTVYSLIKCDLIESGQKMEILFLTGLAPTKLFINRNTVILTFLYPLVQLVLHILLTTMSQHFESELSIEI